MIKKRSVLIVSLIFLLFGMSYVFAIFTATPTSVTVNQTESYLYNFTINNSDIGQNGNLTQLNITLPDGFIYIANSSGTNRNAAFSNTSNVLSFTNSTVYVINGSVNNSYFWFNATPNFTVGSYNMSITGKNGTLDYVRNITISVLDITPPYAINFTAPLISTYTNLSSAAVNITASDDVGVSIIRVLLRNATAIVNSTNVSGSNAYLNFTGLSNGTYFINATANDSVGNLNNSAINITFTVDTVKPTLLHFVKVDSTSTRINIAVNFSDDRSGISNCYLTNIDTDDVVDSSISSNDSDIPDNGLSCDHTYTYRMTCIDNAGNANSSDKDFSTDDCSSSSGSGSGSTSTATSWSTRYNVNATAFTNGFNGILKYLERMKLNVSGQTHYVGVVRLTSSKATINISSNPQQGVFAAGDVKKFNLDTDNYYDIEVKVNSVNSSATNVTVKYVHDLVSAPTTNGTTNTTRTPRTNVTNTNSSAGNSTASGSSIAGKSGLIIIILAIVAVIVFALVWVFKERKMLNQGITPHHALASKVKVKHH